MRRRTIPHIFVLLAALAPCCACVAINQTTGPNPPTTAALKFTMQPGATPVGSPITPAVVVQALDAGGQGVEGVAVTMSIGTNAADNSGLLPNAQGVLNGTLTQITDAQGDATFEDLRIDWLGKGYTLVVAATTAAGTISVTSNPFDETRVGDVCLGPAPACSSGCADTDGDGLNDAWEIAGGVDLNGDGRIDAQHDLLLPAADPHKPDIFVWYDWMDYGLQEAPCSQDSQCTALGGGHLGETCTGPEVLPDEPASCVYTCEADTDCTTRFPSGTHAGDRCVQNQCQHTHDPLALDGPNALAPVVDRFAAHGINLHLLRGKAQPHSRVISYRPAEQMDENCEGASVAAGTAGYGKYAVSLYDTKPRSSPDALNLAYHYGLFGHYVGCDSALHCTQPQDGGTSDCTDPNITQGLSGLARVSGHDFVVALGGLINDEGFSPHYIEQATTMHELGHNLGLRHDGHLDYACNDIAPGPQCLGQDVCVDLGDGEGRVCHEITHEMTGIEEPNYKPNYLSVMNYRYESNGIQIADVPGSTTVLTCKADSDCGADGGMCLSSGLCVRLDYSRQTLPSGSNTPGALDESDLNEPAGLGSGTADLFTYKSGACGIPWTTSPSSGPVDWNGDGDLTEVSVQADVAAKVGQNTCTTDYVVLHGHTDWPDLSGIPFSYGFQCKSVGNPTGPGAPAAVVAPQTNSQTTTAPANASSTRPGAAAQKQAP